jgi:hypothetical protein
LLVLEVVVVVRHQLHDRSLVLLLVVVVGCCYWSHWSQQMYQQVLHAYL